MAKAPNTSTPNFGALLDRPSSEIERPKPMPQGTYTCMVQGLPKFDKSSKKQTEFVEFTYKILAAGDDVDQAELEEMGGIADKTIRDTYYITDASLWRLKDMLDAAGAGDDGSDSLRERIEATPNCQLNVFVKHEASNDGQSVFARVGGVSAVE